MRTLMSNPTAKRLYHFIQALKRNPAAVPAQMPVLEELASELAELPVGDLIYIPGLSLPATNLVPVTGVPDIAGVTANIEVPFKLSTPGVVVGITGALESTPGAPNASPYVSAEFYGARFSLELDNGEQLSFNGSNSSAPVPFSVFGPASPWLPVVLPATGNSNWIFKFTNNGPNPIRPSITFAFLRGERWLSRCMTPNG